MGNLSATEVADTVELWTAPCTVAAARMAKAMAVFMEKFSRGGGGSVSCWYQSECGMVVCVCVWCGWGWKEGRKERRKE